MSPDVNLELTDARAKSTCLRRRHEIAGPTSFDREHDHVFRRIHAPTTRRTIGPLPRRYAWSVFAVLFALMVVDYIDRQVVVSMFPHLKAQWNLSDSQLGGLVSVVSITVALGAVPLSLLADRWSRVKSIFLMVLIWSLATISCAFAAAMAICWRAQRRRLGRSRLRHCRRRAACEPFPSRMRSTVLGAFLAAA